MATVLPLFEPVTTSSSTAATELEPLTVGASFTPVTVALTVSAFAAHGSVAVMLPRFFRSVALVLVVSVWLLSANLTVSEPGVPWKFAAGTKCSWAEDDTRIAVVLPRPLIGTLIQFEPLSSENCHTPCPAIAALPVMATYVRAVSALPPLFAVWLSVVSP